MLAQVVTAPAIGDCEMLNGLKFLADPAATGKPVNDPPAHTRQTLRRLQPLRGHFDLMNLKRQFLDARLFQQLELQDIFQGVQVAE